MRTLGPIILLAIFVVCLIAAPHVLPISMLALFVIKTVRFITK